MDKIEEENNKSPKSSLKIIQDGFCKPITAYPRYKTSTNNINWSIVVTNFKKILAKNDLHRALDVLVSIMSADFKNLAEEDYDIIIGYEYEKGVCGGICELLRYVDELDELIELANAKRPEYFLIKVSFSIVLAERGKLKEALEMIRAAVSLRFGSIYIENVWREILIKLKKENLLSNYTLSNVEEALLEDYSDFFCIKPFTNAEIGNSGDIFMCCGATLPVSIGNVNNQSQSNFWNSENAKKVRSSMLDGSFKFCSRTCENLRSKALPTKEVTIKNEKYYSDIIRSNKVELTNGPLFMNVAHDYSCNLSCPSCRVGKKVASKERQKELDEILERVILPNINDLQTMQIAGDGDPFASKHYRDILKSLSKEKYPKLKLTLLTNGVLLDQKTWIQFSNIHEMLNEIAISIDAACEDTYNILRKGGDWNKLMKNLDSLSGKYHAGAFSALSLNFVIQRENFREIPDFFRLGRSLGVSKVSFVQVHNQLGSFTSQQFLEADVFNPNHKNYDELVSILNDPILKPTELTSLVIPRVNL